MVKSKKYVLVSLVLGLSTPHGINAASAGSESGGVSSGHPSAGVGGAAASGPGLDKVAFVSSLLSTKSPVGLFIPLEPADLVVFSTTASGYTPVPDVEESIKRQLGFGDLMSSREVSLPTAEALLPVIKRQIGQEGTLPFREGSAIANVKGAWRALEHLFAYQAYLKSHYGSSQGGEPAPVFALDMDRLFALDASDVDRVAQKDPSGYTLEREYTPLIDTKNFFASLAEESKRLGHILNDGNIRSGLDAAKDVVLGAGTKAMDAGLPKALVESLSSLAGAMIEGVAKGAESAAAAESPSLFNPDASVRDNVVALYRYVSKLRNHIIQWSDKYKTQLISQLMERTVAAERQTAEAQAEAEGARAPLVAVRAELADARQSLDAVRAELADARASAAATVAAIRVELQDKNARITALQAELVEAQSAARSAADSEQTMRDLLAEVEQKAAQIRAHEQAAAQLQERLVQLAALHEVDEGMIRDFKARVAHLQASETRLNAVIEAQIAASKK